MAGLLLLRSPPHNSVMGQEQSGLRRPSRAAAVEAAGRCMGPGEGCSAVTPAGHGMGACGMRHDKVLGVTEHSGRKEQSTGRAVRDSSISCALGGQRCEQWANGTESWRETVGTLWASSLAKASVSREPMCDATEGQNDVGNGI